MTILVLGASGASGRHLVNQLLLNGNKVKIIVPSKGGLPALWNENNNLDILSRNRGQQWGGQSRLND